MRGPERTDHHLALALKTWEGLPQLTAEPETWPPFDRLADWPPEEKRLRRLRETTGAGLVDVGQNARLGKLELAVARNRPIIEDLSRRHLR